MTEETAKGLLDYLLPQGQQESAITRKVLNAVPAEHMDYKPSEKCMSGIDLAVHIAAAEAFFLNGVLNGAFDWKQPDLKTSADVVAWYDQTVSPLIEKLASLPAAKLAQEVGFMGFMNQPAVTYLSLHLLHNSHHRGQLSAYLRPMGGKVPSIYGPSADEPLQAASGD
jgi:uncharacterized damage-inducible protein DinB